MILAPRTRLQLARVYRGASSALREIHVLVLLKNSFGKVTGSIPED